MNKKALTEADIRTKFITPALVGANGDKWDLMTQVREEVYFTKGRVMVRGKSVRRGVARRADYILVYKPNIPWPSSRRRTTITPSATACSKRWTAPKCWISPSCTAPMATPSWSMTAR